MATELRQVSLPVAVKVWVEPTATPAEAGSTTMEVTAPTLTLADAVPLTVPCVAVTV